MPAPLIRFLVTGAAPLVITWALTGVTMPMSLARIERTGPATSGIWL